MIQHKTSLIVRNLSFLLIANQLRSFSIFGYEMGGGKGEKKRDVYVPPDVDAMTADARKWYLQGVANAEKEILKFKALVEKLEQGEEVKEEFKGLLKPLLDQATEANENTKELVPKLNGLIESLVYWTKDEPISFWSKAKIKATIWYINGKRDNKSYYLQNGAGLWCKLRVEMLKPVEGAEGREMEQDLNNMQNALLLVRDELDDAAQDYVQGIAKLMDLTGDIGKNEKEIREIVKEMDESGKERGPRILKSAQDSVDIIQRKIDGTKEKGTEDEL